MPDHFVIINDAGAIEGLSASMGELLGYAPEELHGKPHCLILETPTPLSPLASPLAWLSGGAHPILHAITRDGKRIPLRLTQHPVEGHQRGHQVLRLSSPDEPVPDDDAAFCHRELYELATNHGGVSVWTIDYRTNHFEFSPVIGRALGLSDAEMPTTIEGWKARFHPDDWSAMEREIIRLLRKEIPEINVECRMRTVDGETLWTLVRGKAFFAGDEPIRAVGTSIDITERKRVERNATVEHAVTRVLAASPSLAEASELILQAICDSLGWELGALWRVEPGAEELRCVQTWRRRPASCQAFEEETRRRGFAKGEGLPGRAWATCRPVWVPDAVHDDNFPRASVAAQVGLHAALAFPIHLQNNVLGVIEFFSPEIKKPDPDLLHMMSAIGSQVGQFMVRRKAEEERDLLFTLSLDLLCIADLNGYFQRVNPAFTKTLGFSSEELLSKPFLDFVHPDDRQATLGAIAELQAGKDVIRFDNRYRCRDGSYRWLSWQTPAPLAGSSQLYAIARDVTVEKEMQARLEQAVREAERANRAKSEFLSRMSHELRTPLNAILGFGQLLAREPLQSRQHEQVELIVKAGRHLLHLINEILDISRIEVGRLDVSPEPIVLSDVLADAIALTRPLAEARGIAVVVEPSATLDCAVFADRQRLKQVLLNLLSNAIKYNIEKGQVRLRAETTAEARIRIHVDDTGTGIPADKLHRLFLPFERLGAETTGIEGSGLGLVLSRRLVEIMGGTLTFNSREGLGTTFTVELAQGKPVLPPSVPTPSVAQEAAVAGPTRTILCIEDNEVNIRLIQAIVAARPSARLVVARQGSAALDLARRERPHLILLDVHLPDTNGHSLLQSLRAEPELSAIPVVIISADATPDQIERLLSSGASAYLTKPIEVDQVLRVIDRHLQ